MPQFTTTDILSATGGRSVLGDGSPCFNEVSTDSRRVLNGSLFVPLKGDNFDGHDYICQSVLKGAQGVLFSSALLPEKVKPLVEGMTLKPVFIQVKDTLLAYQEMAKYHRCRFSPVVIGVTGSNGKSTTKEMIAAVTGIKYRTLKNQGNFNNHIGLPLTLLQIRKEDEVAVLEMGMSRLGEIRRLCEIALPSIGVVTNVGSAHMGNLGSLEKVAEAKSEIIASLKKGGLAILNADDPHVVSMKKKCGGKVLTFGFSSKADVRCTGIKERGNCYDMTFTVGKTRVKARLSCLGVHNVLNALAAVCVGKGLGMKNDEIVRGLESYRALPMRMEALSVGGATVINDAYNANPGSMAAAIKALSEMHSPGKKILVAGDMLELGKFSEKAHKELGKSIARAGFDCFISVGVESGKAALEAVKGGMAKSNVFQCDVKEEAVQVLGSLMKEGDCVLVKGSRGLKMDEVVSGLLTLRKGKV
ncbi:MAG: UDP-N-acetylmuramoyl-tripeptide--D-alanyl-D-alanine ligase [Nitrospinota bacterium]